MSDEAAPAPPPRCAVAVLARSPRAGGKTRLTAGLAEGDAQALRLAICLDALDSALAPGWPVTVYLDPVGDAEWLLAHVAADARLSAATSRLVVAPQPSDLDLGVRMIAAMAATLDTGADVVVLIGSDVPDVPDAALREAAETALRPAHPLVLGPASDGGFYLVAAREADGRVFDGVVWSRDSVCTEVMAKARTLGRAVALVAPWSDIDTPDDLKGLLARRGTGGARTRAVTATWPAYNRQ